MVSRIRPPAKYFGGKYYIAKEIAQLFTSHNTYVETHGGMASVLLNKERAPVEIYNDIDWNVYNFFYQLRHNEKKLQRLLSLTPYSEQEFKDCMIDCTETDDIELARQFYVALRLSQAGRGDAFSCTLHRSRRGMADVVSGYLSAIDEELPKIVEGLREVLYVNRDALDIIEKWDGPDTLFYIDPPYLPETRKSKEVYYNEMTDEQHVELAEKLNKIKGKAVVSGYPSELYDNLYKGWRVHQFNLPNNSAKSVTKERRIETVWLNY